MRIIEEDTRSRHDRELRPAPTNHSRIHSIQCDRSTRIDYAEIDRSLGILESEAILKDE